MHAAAHTSAAITDLLELWLEADLTHYRVEGLAAELAALELDEADFILSWVQRVASVHLELGWQFGKRAPRLLARMGRRQMESWALFACDVYDRAGLRSALQAVEKVEDFAARQLEMTAGVLFEDIAGVLANFVRGLSGRTLGVVQAEVIHTDTEHLFLPAVIARLPSAEDNFKLAKAAVALLWAQTRFGSFLFDIAAVCAVQPDPARALKQFHGLETLRLSARLAQELPGLHREMERLKAELGEGLPPGWEPLAALLARPDARVHDSLACLPRALALPDFVPWCFQGELRPDAVAASRALRQEKEKARLRVKLAELLEEHAQRRSPDAAERNPGEFKVRAEDEQGRLELELTLGDAPVAPPEDVKQLLTSVFLDFGAIPPEYLVPAGDGEYDPGLLGEAAPDPDAVWQGVYHEEGACLYPEWDAGRQHYRKNWAVMREKEVVPVYDDFPRATLDKYAGLVRHLRKAFEAMRDENRIEKRQTQGDEVDLDALVEALADARDGSEMSDRLFIRPHRAERNIAVAFMVDMSGSTRGWINEAEREALILLCEALELLGDRYAIYGFSGITRKRCELFRVKTFDEPYGDAVKARISGIRAQEYTRMGFAIRHLTELLKGVEAKTRVLVTLSDGRPDDYFDGYRGVYGIEDTRMALQEARRNGVHPFCITIDREARDYLPHMYGAARYIILDDVRQLPMKVSDIYRRITS
ncbi:MAG: nitric oxide reductase activation protein [Betaproteobacteria bacterium]|nr:nitric oxide reductase activation protein [Betaproteobacteria bacterium]